MSIDEWPTAIFREVVAEMQQQDQQWGEQNHPDGTNSLYKEMVGPIQQAVQAAANDGHLSWQLILQEEVTETFAEEEPDLLHDELIQVIAVCVQWLLALDRRVIAEADAQTIITTRGSGVDDA